jgi:hypothetical protein
MPLLAFRPELPGQVDNRVSVPEMGKEIIGKDVDLAPFNAKEFRLIR